VGIAAQVAPIVLLGSIGCTRHVVVRVDLAEPIRTPGAASMLLAEEYKGALTIQAYGLDQPLDPKALPFIDPFSDEVRYVALVYAEPLSAFYMHPGMIERPGIGDDNNALPIPTTTIAALIATAEGDIATAWRPLAARDPELLAMKYKSDIRVCGGFYVSTIPAPGYFDYWSAALLDDHTALAVSPDDNIIARVTSATVTKLPTIENFHTTSIFRAFDGEIWLGGKDGQVRHGTPDRGWKTTTASKTAQGEIRWMAGPRESSPFELYIMSLDGTLIRFDGSTWMVLRHGVPVDPQSTDRIGALVWISPGVVLAFPPNHPDATTFTTNLYQTSPSGEVQKIDFRQVALVDNLAVIPGFGAVLLTDFGTTFEVSRSGATVEIGTAMSLVMPLGLAPDVDGFIVVGGGGNYAEYSRGLGRFCTTEAQHRSLCPRGMIPMMDGYLVYGRGEGADPNNFGFFTRKR
jgi:hypothetical protein